MTVTIAPLGPLHVNALKALLAKDASHNMFLLGLMEEFGVVSRNKKAPFAFYGRFEAEELTAVLFVGGMGGLLVPSLASPASIAEIAAHLVGKLKVASALGEESTIDALVRRMSLIPRTSIAQRLYSVSPNDLGPFTNPLLRLATERDFAQLVPMAADCIREHFHRDPLAEDAQGFETRVRQRIRSQRTYVLEEKGRLVFKLDVGSRSQLGAELEGFYTIPDERRSGHATLCLGQISRFLMSSIPRLTVRINHDAPHLVRAATKVGYLPGRAQRLIWM